MPPFRLEMPDKSVANKRKPKMFFTKNAYQPDVKITDWDKHFEGLPIDKDPYCPGNLNYFLGHYDKFGTSPSEPLTTTTQIMLEQIYAKEDVERLYHIPHKYMVNYYSYKDTLACENALNEEKVCPELCAERYVTTMQNSYTPPHPYIMQRFSFPKIPFLQNRRYKWLQSPEAARTKFFDDEYIRQVNQIQQIKGFRTKSYEPSLAINTDGSLPQERKQKCFELGF